MDDKIKVACLVIGTLTLGLSTVANGICEWRRHNTALKLIAKEGELESTKSLLKLKETEITELKEELYGRD